MQSSPVRRSVSSAPDARRLPRAAGRALRDVATELKPELGSQFRLPLFKDGGRADDEDAICPTPSIQFTQDQAGLDRLSQANIVGDQHARPRQFEGP